MNWYTSYVTHELNRKCFYTPQKYLENTVKKLMVESNHWNEVFKNGCGDENWSDGLTLNLTRENIAFYKNVILELCRIYEMTIPAAYYLPIPPEVSEDYMADLELAKQRDKYKRKGTQMVFVFDKRKKMGTQLMII